MAPSSSWVTKEGWALKPTSTWPSFMKRQTYWKRASLANDRKIPFGEWVPTYLGTEAVTDSADALNAQVSLDVLDGRLDNGVDVGGLVVREPSANVELAGLHGDGVDGVAAEQVGEDTQVSVVGELIGEELSIVEETEDVAQEEDSLLGGPVVLGVDNVGVDCLQKTLLEERYGPGWKDPVG